MESEVVQITTIYIKQEQFIKFNNPTQECTVHMTFCLDSAEPYHQQKIKIDECTQWAVPPYLDQPGWSSTSSKAMKTVSSWDGHTMKGCTVKRIAST